MHAPGSYPVIVIGSGPGGLQMSRSLSELGVRHALISADPSPGGMFRRWPFFQRLLSWTKPYALAEPGTPAYERSDWNSLLSNDAASQGLQRGLMDGTSSFPTRAEMEANLAAFADRAAIDVRTGCTWQSTRLVDEADGTRFVLETTDGAFRCAVLVVAVGVAEPWMPTMPGMELVHHYGQVQPAETLRGQAGVHHRQAELGLRACHGPAAVGPTAGPRVTLGNDPLGGHPDARRCPGPVPPAV